MAQLFSARSHARTRVVLGVGLLLLLCLGLSMAGLASYNLIYFVREQLRPSLTSAPRSPSATVPATSTATSSPACGGPPAMFVLLIGSDSRANNYSAGLADSIRIARLDFVQPGITYLTFQRDLYVEIPGISSHGGITHGKLNQAYLYGNPAFGYSSEPGQGPGLLALTLKQNFGAQVDHYVAVNLQSFTQIIDKLGGMDIDLPATVDGRAGGSNDPDRYFRAGPLHLSGYRTMLLARLRPDGDLERSKIQDLILQALAAKLLSPSSLAKLPELIPELYGSIQTDLSVNDIRQLLCLGSMLNADKIHAVRFPEDLFTGSRIQDPVLGYTFVWDVDFNVLQEYVRAFNSGTWPTPLTPAPTLPGGTP